MSRGWRSWRSRHHRAGVVGGRNPSATFNLGLLEGLHKLNLLRLFDYVSTVSGGGYIGSMWSEWLAKRRDAMAPKPAPPNWAVPPEALFPPTRTTAPRPAHSNRTRSGTCVSSAGSWRRAGASSKWRCGPRWSPLFPGSCLRSRCVVGDGSRDRRLADGDISAGLQRPAAALPAVGLLTAAALLGLEFWWQTYKLGTPNADAGNERERDRVPLPGARCGDGRPCRSGGDSQSLFPRDRSMVRPRAHRAAGVHRTMAHGIGTRWLREMVGGLRHQSSAAGLGPQPAAVRLRRGVAGRLGAVHRRPPGVCDLALHRRSRRRSLPSIAC